MYLRSENRSRYSLGCNRPRVDSCSVGGSIEFQLPFNFAVRQRSLKLLDAFRRHLRVEQRKVFEIRQARQSFQPGIGDVGTAHVQDSQVCQAKGVVRHEIVIATAQVGQGVDMQQQSIGVFRSDENECVPSQGGPAE